MRTSVCEMLDIDVPIFAFSHCRDVVVEVSKSGGFGVLGAVGFTPERLEEELNWIDRNIGDYKYGIDFLIPASRIEEDDTEKLKAMIPDEHQEFIKALLSENDVPELPPDHVGHLASAEDGATIGDRPIEMLRTTLEKHKKITFYANALGTPPPEVMELCRSHNIRVAAMAGEAKHAAKHKAAGCDIVIAVGGEAAGHTGDISTLVLTPQVVKEVSPMPVLAAGGIGSGAQIAAAIALGAEGVWTGSLWLPTQQSELTPIQRSKVIASTSKDTVRSRCMSGKPNRMIKSGFTAAWDADDAPKPLPFPLQYLLTSDAAERFAHFSIEEMVSYPAGQVIGMLNDELSVRQVFQSLMEDYIDAVERVAATLDL
ncbi:MAG: nitronate monooxygenase family protein [Gammaproteobacteria bacterium]|nr:nitronate monooxygenase family protein [Gammaproteobacteria bacterium]